MEESESKLLFDMFQTISLDNRLNMQKTFNLKDQSKTLLKMSSTKLHHPKP